jgi:tRNA A37 N6-isopentenylltransferase MiaA
MNNEGKSKKRDSTEISKVRKMDRYRPLEVMVVNPAIPETGVPTPRYSEADIAQWESQQKDFLLRSLQKASYSIEQRDERLAQLVKGLEVMRAKNKKLSETNKSLEEKNEELRIQVRILRSRVESLTNEKKTGVSVDYGF